MGGGGGAGELQKNINAREKKSSTPINPKKIFMLWPKKKSYKESGNEKKIPAARKSPPPPITFLMVRP